MRFAHGVGLLVDWPLHLSVRLGRDHRVDTAPFEVVSDGVAVVALVAEHGFGQRRFLRHEIVVGRHVGGLAGRHVEADRQPFRIRSGMNLGREPTARTANTVSLNPPLPPAPC
jgi:hypothetical protein